MSDVCLPLVFLQFLFELATEIRCQEKSKGGVCYEVILGQPAITVPPLKQNKQAPTAKKVSVDEIERKLCEAEKRRLVRENCKFYSFWMRMNSDF